MLLYIKEVKNMDKMYSVKEVATLLSLAEITIRQWIQRGKIESIKIGSARRISENEVKRLLKGE